MNFSQSPINIEDYLAVYDDEETNVIFDIAFRVILSYILKLLCCLFQNVFDEHEKISAIGNIMDWLDEWGYLQLNENDNDTRNK